MYYLKWFHVLQWSAYHILGNSGLEKKSHCPVLFRMLFLFMHLYLKLWHLPSKKKKPLWAIIGGKNTPKGRNILDCILTHILCQYRNEAVMRWSLFAYLIKFFSCNPHRFSGASPVALGKKRLESNGSKVRISFSHFPVQIRPFTLISFCE